MVIHFYMSTLQHSFSSTDKAWRFLPLPRLESSAYFLFPVKFLENRHQDG